jgi:uncharacterized protein YkwD
MRNSALLASALAVGASAMPHLEKRATITLVRTEIAYATITVVVTITAGVTPTSQTPILTLDPSDTGAPIDGSLTSSTIPSISAEPTSTVVVVTPSAVVSSAPGASLTVSVADASSSASPTSPSATNGVGPDHISGPQQATFSAGADYRNAILYHHNQARANHGAGELTWCTDCVDAALTTAQTCEFVHSIPDGVQQGQNLFTVSGDFFNVTAGITESWYKSEFAAMAGHYGEASLSDSVFHQVGHLTQVLWKGTTTVGCVSLDCGDRMIVNGQSSNLNKFTVCNYFPQGNIRTLYGENVGDPISTTDLGSWSD